MPFSVSTSSGLKSADAAIYAGNCLVTAIYVIPTGATPSVALYDNPSAASGTVKVKGVCVASGASDFQHFDSPIEFNTGVYADTTNCDYIVFYVPL